MNFHPSLWLAEFCSVEPWVEFGEDCFVREFAVVGRLPSQHPMLARKPSQVRSLRIGSRVDVGPHAIIFGGAWIGDDCLIGDAASVREGARIGHRCIIGRHVTINYEAVLGDDVKVQDGTHITGGCRIGAGSFIGVNVTTSNDRRREIVDYEFVGVTPPVIGEGCLIGSGACIVPGVTIGDGAVVGAGALVVKDVPPGGTVLGAPGVTRDVRGMVVHQPRLVTDAERQLAAFRGVA